jgi:hypothetical protein
MQERVRVKVDEGELQQMMAADVPIYRAQKMPNRLEVEPEQDAKSVSKQEMVSEPEITQDMEDAKSEVENSKTQKKRKNPKADFAEIFLKDNKIKDRRQIYISKEAYDKISRYLRYIGQGNVSLVSYVDNIIFHHIDEYKDAINDMYNKNFSTPL